MNLQSSIKTSLLFVSAATIGCASVQRDDAPLAYIPTLERLCFDRDGDGERGFAAGRGLTHTCFLMPPAEEGEARNAFTRPEETVWSRVTESTLDGKFQHVAHGRLKEDVAGNVRWLLGRDGRIAEASLVGHFGISWRWDEDQAALAQLDLVWPDRQVTVTGRKNQALRVQVGFGGARYWESTVVANPDGQAQAREAWIADGRLDVPFPDGAGPMAVYPMCPLGDREVWNDWNGRFPRVMRCLRADAEWLRLERDGRGRVVAVSEKRVRGVDGAVAEEDALRSFERTIRITWHQHGMVPERIWVEVDARKDGLEALFSARGVPELTRQYRRGLFDGLAVIWEKARARGVRMYAAGEASDLELVTRWTEGQKSGRTPELKFGLETDESVRTAGDTGLVWPE